MKLLRNYKRTINREFESLVEDEILVYDSEHGWGKVLKIDQPEDFEEKREKEKIQLVNPRDYKFRIYSGRMPTKCIK